MKAILLCIVLAVIPTVEADLPGCERFLTAVGIQMKGPVQSQAKLYIPSATARELLGESAQPYFVVADRYVLKFADHRVWRFSDIHDDPVSVAVIRDAEVVRRLARKECALGETQAVAIATNLFRKLGFNERAFVNRRVERIQKQADDPDRPGTKLDLPATYRVGWIRRPFWKPFSDPEVVDLDISCATSNLVRYFHSK
jgi:hypothetical protein